MSLLDYQPDPLGQGLLGAGMALMTPRAMGGGVPAAFGAFNQGMLQAQALRRQIEQDAMQRKLLDLRMAEAAESAEDRKRKREQERALQDAARAAYTPASPGSLGGGVAPGSQQGRMLLDQMSGDPEFDRAMLSGTNAALNTVGPQQPVSAPTAGGFDMNRFFSGVAQVAPLEAMRLRKEMIGDNKPVVVGDSLVAPDGRVLYEGGKPQAVAPGGALVGRDGSVVFQNPDRPPAPTEIERLIAARNALPPGHPDRQAIDDRILALNYRQPGASMNVSYGAPFEGVGPDGRPGLYQPSNRGGPPVATGLAPPPKPGKDLPEGAAKQVVGARNLRDAISSYQAALQNWDRFSVVSPSKVASMDTLYNNMMLQAKEAYNLGVLNGPDYEIMTRVVTPPASLRGMMYGSDALSKQASTLSDIARGIERQVVDAHPSARQNAPAGGNAAPQSFPMLPNAAQYDGKTVRDTQSGKRYKSVDGKWVEQP